MDTNIFYKLYTGTNTLNGERVKYALTIDYVAPQPGEHRSYDVYEAKLSAANSHCDIVDVFMRGYDTKNKRWSAAEMKRDMLEGHRANFS